MWKHRAGSPPQSGRVSPALAHVLRAIQRYSRDLALMEGRLAPAPHDIDDLCILERLRFSGNSRDLINECRLRIKTLQATRDLLLETS